MANNYRYELFRNWIGTRGVVNFIMLNPSTADDMFDDPTIRRCIGFAKIWGFSGLVVTNLFAYRATDPKDLKRLKYPAAVGDLNDSKIVEHARSAAAIVCAWGAHGVWCGRDRAVLELLSNYDLGCIGFTRDQNPMHPVRAPYVSAPLVYRIRQAA